MAELPRGRYYPLLHFLEGRPQGGQDLSKELALARGCAVVEGGRGEAVVLGSMSFSSQPMRRFASLLLVAVHWSWMPRGRVEDVH